MAIQIEQEKKEFNWGGFFAVVIILAIIFIGGYFLFFQKPELIDVVSPSRLQEVRRLSQAADFDPKEVLESPIFRSFRDYRAPLTIPPAGRDNPFRPF